MTTQNALTDEIQTQFITMLDTLHSAPEIWDNELDAKIHRWYSDPPKLFPKRPYFSPSSTNSCPRELYVKAKGAKRDESDRQPHQARWQRIGTAIGDIIQRDVLLCERHYRKIADKDAPFRFLRTASNQPAFEEFAKANVPVRVPNADGELVEFNLFGAPDGIMEYRRKDGEVIRVGLEIKSKQTTAARTSDYSLRNAEDSHVKQCVAYSYMYACDYYIVLYVNASKKSWHMELEDYAKSPDIRAFCYYIDDADRFDLLTQLADIQTSINTGDPMPLDVDKWTFNNFKQACVDTLSDEEIADIEAYADSAKASGLPEWRKNGIVAAVDDIKQRKAGGSND